MARNPNAKRREGRTPVNILLTAVRRAVDVGVEPGKTVIMLDLAISASEPTSDGSAKQQANTWRECAKTRNKWSDAIKPAEDTEATLVDTE